MENVKTTRETSMQNKPAGWTTDEWSKYIDICEDADKKSNDRSPMWDLFEDYSPIVEEI